MKRFIVSLIVAVVAVAAVGAAVVLANEGDPHQKVTICHATGSQSNPYVSIDVNINSIQDAEKVGGHGKHADDIIPSFTFTDSEGSYTYPGQNLDKSDILDNGCKVPGQPTPTPTPTPDPTPTPGCVTDCGGKGTVPPTTGVSSNYSGS